MRTQRRNKRKKKTVKNRFKSFGTQKITDEIVKCDDLATKDPFSLLVGRGHNNGAFLVEEEKKKVILEPK